MYLVNDQGEGDKHTVTHIKGSLSIVLFLWLRVFLFVLLFDEVKTSDFPQYVFLLFNVHRMFYLLLFLRGKFVGGNEPGDVEKQIPTFSVREIVTTVKQVLTHL